VQIAIFTSNFFATFS